MTSPLVAFSALIFIEVQPYVWRNAFIPGKGDSYLKTSSLLSMSVYKSYKLSIHNK